MSKVLPAQKTIQNKKKVLDLHSNHSKQKVLVENKPAQQARNLHKHA